MYHIDGVLYMEGFTQGQSSCGKSPHVLQGHKKMLSNGGADLVGGPTYLRGSGGMLPQKCFSCACSEINAGAF